MKYLISWAVVLVHTQCLNDDHLNFAQHVPHNALRLNVSFGCIVMCFDTKHTDTRPRDELTATICVQTMIMIEMSCPYGNWTRYRPFTPRIVNHKIKHKALNGSKPSDCWVPIQSSSGVCGGMHRLTYTKRRIVQNCWLWEHCFW